MTESKDRIRYIDVARSIAIISISMNHAVNRSFHVSSGSMKEFASIPFWMTVLKAVFNAFSRIGVPLFLMISGALLLFRSYEGDGWKRFIKKNWLPLFITTEIWLVIMFWFKQILPGSVLAGSGLKECIKEFAKTVLFISPTTMASMWYMEMILCAYLLIPILAVAVRHIPKQYFLFPCMIVIICSYLIPDVKGVLTGLGKTVKWDTKLESANVFSMYIVYILLGHYIHQGLLSGLKKSILLCLAAASTLVFCAVQVWVWSTPYEYVFAKSYKDIFILIASASVFELLRRSTVRDTAAKVSHGLAEISFGIYFVHICIIEGVNALIKQNVPSVYHLGRMFILEFSAILGSILIIQVMRRIRFFSQYVFCIKDSRFRTVKTEKLQG